MSPGHRMSIHRGGLQQTWHTWWAAQQSQPSCQDVSTTHTHVRFERCLSPWRSGRSCWQGCRPGVGRWCRHRGKGRERWGRTACAAVWSVQALWMETKPWEETSITITHASIEDTTQWKHKSECFGTDSFNFNCTCNNHTPSSFPQYMSVDVERWWDCDDNEEIGYTNKWVLISSPYHNIGSKPCKSEKYL